MDNATLAVLLTFAGTIVSAVSAIGVAIVINGREKRDSAEASAEKIDAKIDDLNTRRLAFKDEKIQELKEKLAGEKLLRVDAEARADRLQQYIDEQRAEEEEQIHDR